MCGLRSEFETRSLFQFLRDLFRREPSQREVAEVIPLPETASGRPAGTEEPKEKRRSEAA